MGRGLIPWRVWRAGAPPLLGEGHCTTSLICFLVLLSRLPCIALRLGEHLITKKTYKTAEYRIELLEGSTFLFGDVPIPVIAADHPICSVFVRDLPSVVLACNVKSAFESFGVVLSVHQCFIRDFLSVANGTRRLVLLWFYPVVCIRR